MILAVDIGTTAVKCALFASGPGASGTGASGAGAGDGAGAAPGSCLAIERAPVAADRVREETDPRVWSDAVQAAVARLPQAAAAVTSCVLTGNGPTLIPCDRAGRPVGPALTWLHARARQEAREVAERTGITVDASFPLPKALWLARRRPAIFERAAWLLSCAEWVVFLLTGTAHTAIGACGVDRFYWSGTALEALGLDADRFPPFAVAGREIGRVAPQAAARFGIAAGARVYAGGADFQMALIGSATVRAGRTLDRSGSSEGINYASPAPVRDARLIAAPHLIGGLHNLGGVTSASGRALEWLAHSAAPSPVAVAAAVERGAAAPAGARRALFLPYLSGERTPHWNPQASGAFLGLTLRHGWDELARAVLESVGFAIRAIIGILAEHGCRVDGLTACGGPARFAAWNRIKADVTGVPVRTLANPEADLVGCACVALTAAGEFDDLASAAAALVRPAREFEPDRAPAGLYAELFDVYQRAGAALQPLYPRLGGRGADEPR